MFYFPDIRNPLSTEKNNAQLKSWELDFIQQTYRELKPGRQTLR